MAFAATTSHLKGQSMTTIDGPPVDRPKNDRWTGAVDRGQHPDWPDLAGYEPIDAGTAGNRAHLNLTELSAPAEHPETPDVQRPVVTGQRSGHSHHTRREDHAGPGRSARHDAPDEQ
jgi:hypothetical protein